MFQLGECRLLESFTLFTWMGQTALCSPVVHGDIALSIKNNTIQYNNTFKATILHKHFTVSCFNSD